GRRSLIHERVFRGLKLFGRYTIEMLVIVVGLCLGLVNSSIFMMWRRINGVELEVGTVGRIHNVMLGALWDDDDIIISHFDLAPIDQRLGCALFNADELVVLSMDFFANFSAHGNRHYYQLLELTCPQHFAEVGILQRLLLDIGVVSVHIHSSFTS